MAKKEATKDNATVAAKTAAKLAADILKTNPDIQEVHITSDGTAFYTRNDAQNHANTLKNRDVFSTKRVSVEQTKKKEKSETETADETENNEATASEEKSPKTDE